MDNVTIDYMFIGVHPDDIEIGCGGMVRKLSKLKNVMMVDLTAGEMGTNGNRDIRIEESNDGAQILGAKYRINLELEDTNLRDDEKTIHEIVETIRKYRPKNIIYPYHKDYHPDHEFGSRLIKKSIFKSGLIKYVSKYEKYRPFKTFCYYINDIESPSFYVDVSEEYDYKIRSLKAHKSQFLVDKEANKTYLNSGFMDKIEARDKYFGSICGCEYAEALYYEKPIILTDLDLIK